MWEQSTDVVDAEAGQEICVGALPGLPCSESLRSGVHNPLWDEESVSSAQVESPSPRAETLCESAVVHVGVAQLHLDC